MSEYGEKTMEALRTYSKSSNLLEDLLIHEGYNGRYLITVLRNYEDLSVDLFMADLVNLSKTLREKDDRILIYNRGGAIMIGMETRVIEYEKYKLKLVPKIVEVEMGKNPDEILTNHYVYYLLLSVVGKLMNKEFNGKKLLIWFLENFVKRIILKNF